MKASRLTPKQMKAASDAARREALKTPPKKMWNVGGTTAAKPPAREIELLASEYTELEGLMDDAATLDHDMVAAVKTVTQMRGRLALAELKLATLRHQSSEVRAKIAPLFHRLPA